MNENDRDLILDLTEGRLSGPEAEAAEARIAASPTLRAELATQQSVHATLAAAEPVRMTVDEQAALSAGLRAQLNIAEAPAPAPVPLPARRSRWWIPVFGLATVAAVLVGFVALGPLGSSDDADTLEVATDLGTEETTLAENGSTLGRSQDDLEAEGGSSEQPDPGTPPTEGAESPAAALEEGDDAAGTAPPEASSDAFEETITYAMDAGGDEADVPNVADAVPPAPELYASLQQTGFSTQTASEELEDDSVGDETVSRENLEACEAQLSGLAPPDLIRVEPLATGTRDGNPVVVLLLEFVDLQYFTVTVDLTVCDIVDAAPATP